MVNRMSNSQMRFIPGRLTRRMGLETFRLSRRLSPGDTIELPCRRCGPEFQRTAFMPKFLRPALCLTLLGLAACDEIAVADDPAALAELRGQKSCVSAVAQQTGASGVAINTTRPIV